MFDLKTYPTQAQTHFRSGAEHWPFAVRAAAAGGTTLDDLADLVFFMHHPERLSGTTGQPLRSGEPNFADLAAEWKTWRVSAEAVAKAPTPRRPENPPTPRPADRDAVLRELRRLESEGVITAHQRRTAEQLAKDLIGDAGLVASGVDTALGLVALVTEFSAAGILAGGVVFGVATVLMPVGFILDLDHRMDAQVRIYRAIAAAYGIVAWVWDEPTPSGCRRIRKRLDHKDKADRNWNDAAATARKAIKKRGRKVGAARLRAIMQLQAPEDLAKAIVQRIADSLPPSREVEADALERIANSSDIRYPN